MGYEYIGEQGDFYLENPEMTSSLYFPLANETGIMGCVTPDLGGDSKIGQNAFLLPPQSSWDLHNDKSSRNFWCVGAENVPQSLTLAGRERAFSPGWLENESVWLHMEYKYLLELLKSGLYKEFFDAMKDACIPFLDSGVYGRSTLENCSFLVSSANSNRKLWGHGYVSRLSGATAEC